MEGNALIVHGGALTRPIHQLLVTRKFTHIVIGHPSDTRINWVDTVSYTHLTLPTNSRV